MASVQQIGNAIRTRRTERIQRLISTLQDGEKGAFLDGMVLGAFTAGQSYGAATIVDAILASDNVPIPDPLKPA